MVLEQPNSSSQKRIVSPISLDFTAFTCLVNSLTPKWNSSNQGGCLESCKKTGECCKKVWMNMRKDQRFKTDVSNQIMKVVTKLKHMKKHEVNINTLIVENL